MIRWLPHQKMIADCLTKESLDRSNGALVQFLKSGWLRLVDVAEELEHRRTNSDYRKRSLKGSTDRLRKECEDELQAFCTAVMSTVIGGDCETCPGGTIQAV